MRQLPRLAELEKVAARYAIAVTPEIAALIDPDDPADPIARQFIPSAQELVATPGESADPIGDDAHSPVPGIVHRYPDRVLFKLVHVCAVYCRFCFRREMVGPGKPNALSDDAYRAALDYIRGHGEIWEVILTGGDPLDAVAAPACRDHGRSRRHRSRQDHPHPYPRAGCRSRAGQPGNGCGAEGRGRNDLDCGARQSSARILPMPRAPPARGWPMPAFPLVSQSVLLRGVNDDAATLEALMRTFVELRIKPYYLHHGDLAPGTAHLRTTLEQGQALMRALARARLRPVPAGICAGYPRRPRQGAGRAELFVAAGPAAT